MSESVETGVDGAGHVYISIRQGIVALDVPQAQNLYRRLGMTIADAVAIQSIAVERGRESAAPGPWTVKDHARYDIILRAARGHTSPDTREEKR